MLCMEGGTAAPEEEDGGAKWKISTLVCLCLGGGRLGSDYCCDSVYC